MFRVTSDEQRKWVSKRSRHGAHEVDTIHLIQACFTFWNKVFVNWGYCIALEARWAIFSTRACSPLEGHNKKKSRVGHLR
mmetsp:Transcript_65816/g.113144  ORF Transcript_65816/g.113144 Transcript_65816/m.113144 type:complete len:80 (+) Transcript_65816:282-521(+)